MTVRVRLLGAPQIASDGETSQPRGRKSWALLARLTLASRPLGREELARMLFGQAANPAGALRWSLAELRRSLGRSDLLKGDPVTLRADEELDIDVLRLDSHDVPSPDLDGELLAGMEPEDCPVFSAWLMVERHRLRARLENDLRDAAHRRAATGDWKGALGLAGRAVSLNPLDESLQELFVRCLAMNGDERGARAQVQRCEELFADRLGTQLSVALRLAASARAEPRRAGRDEVEVESLLEAGRSAVDAGVVEAGLDTLRRALSEAKRVPSDTLGARAALALGGALVHALRGRDEEGAGLLHEAVVMARRSDQPKVAVAALRELGFVDVQAGRRRQADRLLDEAEELAAGDDEALCAILGVRGMNLSDFGRYADAAAMLHESVERAVACDKPRQVAWSTSLLGRLHMLRGEHAEAARFLERSLELVERERWTAFAPWPRALWAELAMREGRAGAETMKSLRGTFALACQVADPCWEGMSARALALLSYEGGDQPGAQRWIDEAETRCNRGVDPYVWMQAYVMDGRCELLIREGRLDEGATVAGQMAALAARTEQREHLVRALAYKGQTGDATALIHAQAVADEIDNDALSAWLKA